MIEISKMLKEDIPKNLENDFDDFWNTSLLQNEIDNPNSYSFVAKENDEVIGFITLWESVDDVHVTNIVVRKDLRHNGIGTALLQYAIDFTKTLNKNLTLEVNEKNIYAKDLYLKLGFKILGTRKKYYKGTDDAIIMTLQI